MDVKRNDRENRIAADWLLYLPDRREEVRQLREDIEQRSPSTSVAKGFGGDCGISDKTGQAAAQLTTLAEQEKWIRLIERIEANIMRSRKEFLEARRDNRATVGEYSARLQCRLGGEHRNTYYRWWRELVEVTVREAIREGLL